MHSRQGLLPTFNIDKNINKILKKMKSFLSITLSTAFRKWTIYEIFEII